MPLNSSNIIANKAGALPISIQYAPLGSGTSTIFFSGSAYSESDNKTIGFQLKINGDVVGESLVFSDARKQHRATVPVMLNYDIPFVLSKDDLGNDQVNKVTIELVALEGTSTNEHDVFNLTISQ